MIIKIKENTRIHYMDGMRVVFAFMGIMFHLAFWYILNPEQLASVKTINYSKDFFWIAEVISLFRMDSFFLITGFFTAMGLVKLDFQSFLRKRVKNLRILSIVPIVFAITTIISYLMQLSIGSFGPLSPRYWKTILFEHHLWFLEVLFIYYIIYGFLLKKTIFVSFMQYKIQPLHLLSLGFIYLIWAFLAKVFPILWSDNFLADTVYRVFIYLPYFFLGAVIFFNKKMADSFMKPSLIRVFVSLISISSYLYFVNQQYGVVGGYSDPVFTIKLIKYFVKGFANLGSVYLVFLASSYIFKNDSKLLKYLADRSYSVYLLHYPLCLIFGYFFTKVNLDTRFEYAASVVSVYVITLLMHDVLMKMIKPEAIKLENPLGGNIINT